MNSKSLTIVFLIIFTGYMLYNMTSTHFRIFKYKDNIFHIILFLKI